MPQWVPYPPQIPHQCWFNPAIDGANGLGFIEGLEIDGLRAYISLEMVFQIAGQYDWAPIATAKDGRLEKLREQVKEKDARIAELEAALDAVDVLKRNREFVEGRRPGRPSRKVAA